MSKRRHRSYSPEERLGTLRLSKTKKSLILTIDEVQLARAQKGELERWWRISVKGVDRTLNEDQPYTIVMVSKVPPTANVQAELEDEERIISFEEGEPEPDED